MTSWTTPSVRRGRKDHRVRECLELRRLLDVYTKRRPVRVSGAASGNQTRANAKLRAWATVFEARRKNQDPHQDGNRTRIWAFVIAIDVYQNPQIKNLHGCVNDGDDVYDYLTNALRVPRSQIFLLKNEKATRTGIIDTFFSRLIDNPAIKRDDTVIVYYAGHGDRRSAPVSWSTAGALGMVELICPHDEGMPDEGGRPTIGIPDRTFGGLMRRLAHEKGDNVVAIFDCCHSGGMHRSGPASVTSETRHLPTGSQLPRPPIPETLDQYIWAWQDPDAGRGAAMVPVAQPETGFSDPEARSHVLLAACQSHETAQEHTIGGMPRGVFTYHLLAYMRMKHGEDLTYAQLVDALRKPDGVDVWGSGTLQWMAGQTPLCIGRNKHRLLFTTDEVPEAANTSPVRYDKGLLYVGAGYRNKIVKGMRFIVEVPPELQGHLPMRHVVLTAESVGDDECTVGYGTCGDRVPREIGRALEGKEAVVCTSNLWLWAGVNERAPFFF